MWNRCILAIFAVLLAGCTWLPKHPVLDCSLRPGDETCPTVLRVAARTYPTATVLRATDQESPDIHGSYVLVIATFSDGSTRTISCGSRFGWPIGCGEYAPTFPSPN